ncbi:MAG: cob(I)yrinic acid a,c-diamide adenosyltransferase [Phycisphaerae bacterium]|nr:cob(I)yrinic acid a,c-diamide adenosyltransferase [Phycisphaerae bacterium]
MKIYTRQGDQGQTGLFDGTRVSKDHWRIETYGTVDELNSTLGLAAANCAAPDMQALLLKIQHQLFDLGADLATPADSPNAHRVRRIAAADTEFLEKQIDLATERLAPLKQFVLPGGTMLAAQLHVTRTVCRRAERRLVTLMQHEKIAPQPLIYLNRLSDLLFTLARLANHLENKMDVPWQPTEL